MSLTFIAFAAFIATVRAGSLSPAPLSYSSAPAVSYSTVSAPLLPYSAPRWTDTAAFALPYASFAAPSLAYAPQFIAHAPALQTAPAPTTKTIAPEPEAPANYKFAYSVNDPLTGDSKSQQETRQGDAVQGSYSLLESDGSKRIVDYTADDQSGFNAVVRKELPAMPFKSLVPLTYAAPALKIATAPLADTAPPLKIDTAPLAYTAPASKIATAPLAYTAPALKIATAPLAYTAPALKIATAPLAYTAPALKIATAPLAYTAPYW